MAGVTDRYTIEVFARQKGLADLQKKVEKTQRMLQGGFKSARVFEEVGDEVTRLNGKIESQTKSLQKAQLQTTKLGRAWEASKEGVLGFNGALLSTLFFGMELQRITGGALKSIFSGYKTIIPEAHKFNIMTTKLSANWEFFKFQLADALVNTVIFDKLVAGAITAIQWLQKLPAPVKTFIVVALGILFVVGAFMLYVGVIGLGIAGLIDLSVAMGAFGITSTSVMTAITARAKIMWAALTGPVGAFILVFAGALGLASSLFSDFIIDQDKEINGLWNNIKAGAITFVSGLGNIIALAITGFLGVFTLLYDSFKMTLESMIDVAGSFGSAIVEAIKAGITGGLGEAKEAFLKEFDVADISQKLQDNFTNNFSDGATAKLGEFSRNITDQINQWNTEQLNKIATPKSNQLESALNDFQTMPVPEPGVGGKAATNNNTEVYIQLGEENIPSIDSGGIKTEIDKILKDAGISNDGGGFSN